MDPAPQNSITSWRETRHGHIPLEVRASQMAAPSPGRPGGSLTPALSLKVWAHDHRGGSKFLRAYSPTHLLGMDTGPGHRSPHTPQHSPALQPRHQSTGAGGPSVLNQRPVIRCSPRCSPTSLLTSQHPKCPTFHNAVIPRLFSVNWG